MQTSSTRGNAGFFTVAGKTQAVLSNALVVDTFLPCLADTANVVATSITTTLLAGAIRRAADTIHSAHLTSGAHAFVGAAGTSTTIATAVAASAERSAPASARALNQCDIRAGRVFKHVCDVGRVDVEFVTFDDLSNGPVHGHAGLHRARPTNTVSVTHFETLKGTGGYDTTALPVLGRQEIPINLPR